MYTVTPNLIIGHAQSVPPVTVNSTAYTCMHIGGRPIKERYFYVGQPITTR